MSYVAAGVLLIIVVLLAVYAYSKPNSTVGRLVSGEDDNTNPPWTLHMEGDVFVMRDTTAPKDSRYAFYPGKGKNYGDATITGPQTGPLGSFGSFAFEEEKGALKISAPGTGNTWYFYPGPAVQKFGTASEVPSDTRTFTFIRGRRWSIKQEKGYLMFKDRATGGGYVFAPRSYVDL